VKEIETEKEGVVKEPHRGGLGSLRLSSHNKKQVSDKFTTYIYNKIRLNERVKIVKRSSTTDFCLHIRSSSFAVSVQAL
jgi:hypothetical protein